MPIETIAELLQVALPTGLIVIGVWFVVTEVWPYYKERDADTRKFDQDMRTREIESDTMLAQAITALARHIENPIRVKIERDAREAP